MAFQRLINVLTADDVSLGSPSGLRKEEKTNGKRLPIPAHISGGEVQSVMYMTCVSQDPLICIISFRQGHDSACVFEDGGVGCGGRVGDMFLLLRLRPWKENKREITVSRGFHSSQLI